MPFKPAPDRAARRAAMGMRPREVLHRCWLPVKAGHACGLSDPKPQSTKALLRENGCSYSKYLGPEGTASGRRAEHGMMLLLARRPGRQATKMANVGEAPPLIHLGGIMLR